MSMTYGALTVEGTSWTHPDNIALQLANTVSIVCHSEITLGLFSLSVSMTELRVPA